MPRDPPAAKLAKTSRMKMRTGRWGTGAGLSLRMGGGGGGPVGGGQPGTLMENTHPHGVTKGRGVVDPPAAEKAAGWVG